MSLFKLLFKIVAKWLIYLTRSVEEGMAVSDNGKAHRNGKSPGLQYMRFETLADNALGHITQVVSKVERRLDQKLNNEPGISSAGVAVEPEVNELYAEVAELKAEVRRLRRLIETNLDIDDGNH